MLYDEEGNAYVEPPLLPEDQQLRYIVTDYCRMSRENERLSKRNEKLLGSLKKLNGLQYAYSRIVAQLNKDNGWLIKTMKRFGHSVPDDIKNNHEEINYMMIYYNTHHKR